LPTSRFQAILSFCAEKKKRKREVKLLYKRKRRRRKVLCFRNEGKSGFGVEFVSDEIKSSKLSEE